MNDNNLELKKAYRIRCDMDCECRHYIFTPDSNILSKKEYSYTDSNRQLLKFASDVVGMVSDCYILYAVGYLGTCDKETMRAFLINMQTRYPELYIGDVSDENAFSRRVHALVAVGFLFVVRYNDAELGESAPGMLPSRLYSLSQDAAVFMNQKLTKRVPYNKWVVAKPLNQLIGWAAAAFIGASLSGNKYHVSYLENVFRNRSLGSFFMPCAEKFFDGQDYYYVSFIDAFLIRDEKSQTEHDFAEFEVIKLNTIRNFVLARTKNGIACVVIVVEDNKDLVAMAKLLLASGAMLDVIDHLYFTSEGAYRKAVYDKDAFLQMTVNEVGNDGAQFDFVAVQPPFLN